MARVAGSLAGVLNLHRLCWKRSSLLLAALTVALCSASYLLAAWSGGGGSGAAPLASAPCNLSSPPPISSSAIIKLDFSLHHAAESSPAAAVRRFPACGREFVEYTPCEDRERSLRFPRERLQYKERHCPSRGELLKCLVAAPAGYRPPLRWPESRDAAWFANVPHKELVAEKGGQNWVRAAGDKFRFPGSGTMFPHGAGVYIDEIGRLIPLHDGSIRTAVDTGCGVASWGAYLLSRNIVTMSFAPVCPRAWCSGDDRHPRIEPPPVPIEELRHGPLLSMPHPVASLWCEAMSTYPRTYDLLHADALFSLYQERCEMEDILLEMDRILRPEGTVIFRDDVDVLVKAKSIVDGMKWESRIINHEVILDD